MVDGFSQLVEVLIIAIYAGIVPGSKVLCVQSKRTIEQKSPANLTIANQTRIRREALRIAINKALDYL